MLRLAPAVLVSNTTPDLMASLDGFNEEESLIFEAKLVGEDALEKIKQGEIKPDHECQVQAQLKVSGAKKCIYFATTPKGNSAVVEITPKPEYGNKIAEEALRFMNAVRAGNPPEPTEKDYFKANDPRFAELLNCKIAMDKTDEAYQKLKSELLSEYKQYKRIKASGLIISRVMVKGAVDYDKIPELQAVDREQYRKKPFEKVDVRLEKKKAD